MEKDLDEKLYNDYLDGQKEAFEFLYNKYKKRIEYFIFNIVKDYQKAEDLTQETFIYVMQNKMKKNASFKYYIYMVAKSRAINHIKIEKRRTEITEEYLYDRIENTEKDVLEIIIKEKTKKGESSFIRVYSNYEGEITITDVNFEDGIYYTNTIVLGTEKKYHNTYKNLKREEVRNGNYKDIEYVFYEGRNSNGGVPLVIIQNWLEDYKKN